METREYYGRAAHFKQPVDIQSLVAQLHLTPSEPGLLKRIISTSVGQGPRLLARGFDPQVSLFDAFGQPKQ